MSDVIAWPKLSMYGFGLRVVKTALNQLAYVPVVKGRDGKFIPYKNKTYHHQLTQCGFRQTNGIYWREASGYKMSMFTNAFPKVERIEISKEKLIIEKPPWASKFWKIGRNDRNEEVFIDFNAKRAVNHNGSVEFESGARTEPRFLRAFDHVANDIDKDSLDKVCDGMALEVLKKKVTFKELVLFASSVVGRKLEPSDPYVPVVYDALEAALQRSMRKFEGTAFESYDLSRRFSDNIPRIHDQGVHNTPFPVSTVVGNIVNTFKPEKEKHVFEPSVGTGSLISGIDNIGRTTGIEPDKNKVRHARGLSEMMSVIEADPRDHGSMESVSDADVVVTRPVSAPITEKSIDGTLVSKSDHEVILNSLSKMKDDGLAVFIFSADASGVKGAGEISDQSLPFLTHLYSRYNVKDIVEMTGAMLSDNDGSHPERMIVISGRKEKPDDSIPPASIRVVHDFDDLWGWQEGVLSAERVSRPDYVAPVEVDDGVYQAKYKPASQLDSFREALIPKNMAAPVAEALETLNQEFGNVDDFVMEELSMSREELASAFSSAQVDAIALAISSFENQNSMIIGDRTGFGKGRTMAGLARYGLLKGKKVIFMTEKPNLFTDIANDFVDIHSGDLIRPLLLNTGAESNIDDREGNVVLRAASQGKDRKSFIDSGGILDDKYNMLFCTYSQINKLYSPKAKAVAYLAATQGMALLDESHNAAGDSNVSKNVSEIIDPEDSFVPTVYSSATAIKSHKNLDIYVKSMDLPYSAAEIVSAAERGGESFLQIFTTMLAREGMIIRREYSLDDVVFEQFSPKGEALEHNRDIALESSSIFADMTSLAAQVSTLVLRKKFALESKMKGMSAAAKKADKSAVNYLGFGGGLHNLNRQLMLVMRSSELIKHVIDDVKAGHKPVVAIDQTMDALISSVLEDVKPDKNGNYILDSKISIADAMSKALDSLMIYREKDAGGTSEKVDVTRPDIVALKNRILDKIESSALLSDLSVGVFDELHQALEKEGYSASEVSGRKWTCDVNEDGTVSYKKRKAPSRNKAIFGFNNGDHDVILLSSAGSTGLSLHSSIRFNDQRQRIMHIAQADLDVVKFIQMLGRVDRNGQVSSPWVRFHTTGMIGEKKELGALLSKLSSLMASSTANRESNINALIGDTVDMINTLGDKAVDSFLSSREDISKTMDISPRAMMDAINSGKAPVGGLAKRFLGRLSVLPPGPTDEELMDMDNPSESDLGTDLFAYNSALSLFNETLAELKANGENPLDVESYNWNSRRLRRQLYSGSENIKGYSAFDAPCYIEEVAFDKVTSPIRFKEVLNHIDRATDRFNKNIEENYGNGLTPYETLAERSEEIIRTYVSPADPSLATEEMIKESLSDPESTAFRASANINSLLGILKDIKPGAVITLKGLGEDDIIGIVTNFRVPKPEELHRMGSYQLSIICPGDERVTSFTGLSFIKRLEEVNYTESILDAANSPYSTDKLMIKDIKDDYDSRPAGLNEVKRVVITGNLIEASMIGKGSLATFTQANGQKATGFVLPSSSSFDAVVAEGIKERCPRTVAGLLRHRDITKLSNMSDYLSRTGIEIGSHIDDQGRFVYKLSVPASKKNGDKFVKNHRLIEFLGEFYDRNSMKHIHIPNDKLDKALGIILPLCGGVHLRGAVLNLSREIKGNLSHEIESDVPYQEPL